MTPLVSVVVPNYNHAGFLPHRMESVLCQDYPNIEVIALDDYSDDNSLELLNRYANADSRISVVSSECNSGSTFVQWNTGISMAKGQFVWIAESDDAASPNFLTAVMAPFLRNPRIVLSYSQSLRMNGHGVVTGTWEDQTQDLDPELFRVDFEMGGKEYIRRFLIHRNTVPNASAVVFRKEAFAAAGLAETYLRNNGDWLLWLKLLTNGDVAFTSEPLNFFRYHENSVIAKLGRAGDVKVYQERYDRSMRKAFSRFVRQHKIQLPPAIMKANAYYMSLDNGYKGLHCLRRRQYLAGWTRVLFSSVYPTLQTGFLKRALRHQ